jgi:GNAT superfamily N-acetyltransferase
MIFESLYTSAERGELILVPNGMLRYHLRKDGQATIYEIVVLPGRQKRGIGTGMLEELKRRAGMTSIFARCPADLESNSWYVRRGFVCEGEETTRTGRRLKLWRLTLS